MAPLTSRFVRLNIEHGCNWLHYGPATNMVRQYLALDNAYFHLIRRILHSSASMKYPAHRGYAVELCYSPCPSEESCRGLRIDFIVFRISDKWLLHMCTLKLCSIFRCSSAMVILGCASTHSPKLFLIAGVSLRGPRCCGIRSILPVWISCCRIFLTTPRLTPNFAASAASVSSPRP